MIIYLLNAKLMSKQTVKNNVEETVISILRRV
jgi:hypothetical protein